MLKSTGRARDKVIQRPASQAGITLGQLEQKLDAWKDSAGKKRGEAEKAKQESR